jgi:hypothetical protein
MTKFGDMFRDEDDGSIWMMIAPDCDCGCEEKDHEWWFMFPFTPSTASATEAFGCVFVGPSSKREWLDV